MWSPLRSKGWPRSAGLLAAFSLWGCDRPANTAHKEAAAPAVGPAAPMVVDTSLGLVLDRSEHVQVPVGSLGMFCKRLDFTITRSHHPEWVGKSFFTYVARQRTSRAGTAWTAQLKNPDLFPDNSEGVLNFSRNFEQLKPDDPYSQLDFTSGK